jgi:heme/copper-type cytochrome/quinol oxidase subunit 1
LHAIAYFWLLPAYTAFYAMAPEAAGGRLYSDTMGRLTSTACRFAGVICLWTQSTPPGSNSFRRRGEMSAPESNRRRRAR